MKYLTTEVVGMQHRVTASTRKMISKHTNNGPIQVKLEREPKNVHDENAIKVILESTPYKGMHIGYVSRHTALNLAPAIDGGKVLICEVSITDIRAEDGDGDLVIGFIKRSKGKVKVT